MQQTLQLNRAHARYDIPLLNRAKMLARLLFTFAPELQIPINPILYNGHRNLSMPPSHHCRRTSAWPLVALWLIFGLAVLSAYSQTPSSPSSSTQAEAITIKPDSRKAKQAFNAGEAAERKQDWATAFENFDQAVEYAPKNKEYALHRENAKAALVQSHVDAAERDALASRFDDARKELFIAQSLDPTNDVIRERLAEFLAEQTPSSPPERPEFAGVPQLNYPKGTHNFSYNGDTRGAYDEIARQFGLRDSFDPELPSRQVRLAVNDIDFPAVMRLMGDMTGTFWRPVSTKMFFVAQDTPQKRRDFDAQAVRTILLPASATPDDMTETLRVVRDIAGISRASLDTSAHAITLRASPQQLELASSIIDGIEQPLGEMVLELEVLEVDKNSAHQLGVVPPSKVEAFALSPQEIAEATSSASGLVAVISQVFGLPTSLSGLSPTQIAGLLGSGNLNVNSLIPPVIAFGGGESTFLATLPGASANFSEMLSLVKHGMRVFLRTQDGVPATAFFGEHFPVSLANYSSSLGGTAIPGVSSTNFPTTNYDAGNSPQFIASAILRNGSAINDLLVANQSSGSVGVFLGNGTTDGDGTFAAQVPYPSDPTNSSSGPVWIATGDFDGDGNIDVAVANKASNDVGILFGSANADGTLCASATADAASGCPLVAFTLPLATGAQPVSVVTGLFHDATTNSHLDLAVADQGNNTISIFQGNGDGTFVTPPTVLQLPNGYSPAGLAAADVNNDGHTDLIVADRGSNNVSVFLSNGDGTFQPRSDYATGQSPVAVAVADLNGDGAPDLAIANNGTATTTNSGDSVTILLGQLNSSNKATGTFAPGSTRDYPAGKNPTSIAIADVNVDGLPDLLVSDGNSVGQGSAGDNALSALIGSGNGSFSSPFELSVGTNPQSLVAEDFNDDSRVDVAAANAGSNNITVVLNSSSVFGGTNGGTSSSSLTPYPNVSQYIDLGFKLKVTPRIHSDDEVKLAIDLTINGLSTQSFNSIPALNNESLTHTVRLKQDETSVIASFMAPETTNTLSGTPGIAGLPGLGWLAQDQNHTDQDTEILILVTPRMVRYEPRENRVVYAGQGVPETVPALPSVAPIFNNVPPGGQAPGTVPASGATAPAAAPLPLPGGLPTQSTPGQEPAGQNPAQVPNNPESPPQNPAQLNPPQQNGTQPNPLGPLPQPGQDNQPPPAANNPVVE